MFASTNVKTELLDPIQFTNNVPTKCGEFYVTKFGEISITCGICVASFDVLTKFTEHIIKGHLKINNEFEEVAVTNTLEIEFLDENILYHSELEVDEASSISTINKDQLNTVKLEDVEQLTCVNTILNNENSTDTEDIEQSDVKKIEFEYQCIECSINFKCKSDYLSHVEIHNRKKIVIKINKKKVTRKNETKKEEVDQCLKENIESDSTDSTHLKELTIEPLEFLGKFKKGYRKNRTNENLPNFSCKLCPKTFERKINLNKHEAKHNSSKFNCNICGKFFPTNFEMKQHIATHTGEKPYSCEECGAAFNCKGNLKNHYLKHSNYRPHACNFQCGKSFKTSRERVWHERIHTGEKPFQCEQCGDNFAHQHKLKLHKKRNHMDPSQRPHKCTFDGCIKAFLFPRQLREHLNTHSGAKPYKCDQCSSAFAKTSGLKEHKKLHSGIRKHVCKVCGKAFTQIAGLATHKKIHTNIKNKSVPMSTSKSIKSSIPSNIPPSIPQKEFIQYDDIEFLDYCKKEQE